MSRYSDDVARLPVSVVLATPARQQEVRLEVPPGTTAREAVHLAVRAGLDTQSLDLDALSLGIFGKPVDDRHRVSAADRVEIYRPLVVDPMTLRRQRARRG